LDKANQRLVAIKACAAVSTSARVAFFGQP
jgi:hypothetical protein